ncbi:hypothetical protein, partial [Rhizobium sp. A37_96]
MPQILLRHRHRCDPSFSEALASMGDELGSLLATERLLKTAHPAEPARRRTIFFGSPYDVKDASPFAVAMAAPKWLDCA